jgi:hypothetical protein
MYRIKEIKNGGITQYVLQERVLWFIWLNMSEPVEDKLLVDALLILFKHKEYKRKSKKK